MTAVTAPGAPTADPARNITRTLVIGLVLMAAALPFLVGKSGVISNFTFLQLSLMIVYAIAVLGLNLLTGFNGQISLGHGAFFAVGAYTAAVLIETYGVNYWLTFPSRRCSVSSSAISSACRPCASKGTIWRSPPSASLSPCRRC